MGFRSLAVVLLAAATPLLAADLGKYADWDQSPQGYFMTAAEREEWAKLASEGEAETFVAGFLAHRGAAFIAEIAKRAEMADKHLTVGETKGSRSLRGKLVILFGAPSAMTITSRAKTQAKRDHPMVTGVHSNAGGVGSAGRSSDDLNPGGALSAVPAVHTYSITFSGEAMAAMIGRDRVTFVIEVDSISGKDKFASRRGGREAGELFERAARASIRK